MVGTNLSNHPNLEFLEADGPTQLLEQIRQIRLPFKIISIYSNGRRHYAWVDLTQPIKKKKVPLKRTKDDIKE